MTTLPKLPEGFEPNFDILGLPVRVFLHFEGEAVHVKIQTPWNYLSGREIFITTMFDNGLAGFYGNNTFFKIALVGEMDENFDENLKESVEKELYLWKNYGLLIEEKNSCEQLH